MPQILEQTKVNEAVTQQAAQAPPSIQMAQIPPSVQVEPHNHAATDPGANKVNEAVARHAAQTPPANILPIQIVATAPQANEAVAQHVQARPSNERQVRFAIPIKIATNKVPEVIKEAANTATDVALQHVSPTAPPDAAVLVPTKRFTRSMSQSQANAPVIFDAEEDTASSPDVAPKAAAKASKRVARSKSVNQREIPCRKIAKQTEPKSKKKKAEPDPIYNYKDIVGHSREKGKMWYLIRWLEYPAEPDSWIKEADFVNKKDVDEYWGSGKQKYIDRPNRFV